MAGHCGHQGRPGIAHLRRKIRYLQFIPGNQSAKRPPTSGRKVVLKNVRKVGVLHWATPSATQQGKVGRRAIRQQMPLLQSYDPTQAEDCVAPGGMI